MNNKNINNNNNKNDIFVKKSEIPVVYDKVELNSVLETIPKGSYKQQQILLAATKTEMRWRFLHIPVPNSDNVNININVKTIVEISRRSPNNNYREYLNKQMEWVKRDISSDYDQYLVDQYFYYTDN